jgi:hypothetical protein
MLEGDDDIIKSNWQMVKETLLQIYEDPAYTGSYLCKKRTSLFYMVEQAFVVSAVKAAMLFYNRKFPIVLLNTC